MSEVNVPKLRFREFEGEWVEKRLGEIATFSKGKGISKSDIVENGKLECIRYGELYTVYGELITNIKSTTNLDKSNLILSEYNDVIIPASGETQIDIATASCILKDNVALSGDLNIIKADSNGLFLAYYLNSAKKIDIAKLAQGISVVHLYSSQLKMLKLNLPQKPEQQKIANFLTSIDQKIEQLTKKEKLLVSYKKGVMQKIFSQEIRFRDENGEVYGDWEEKNGNLVFEPISNKNHNSDLPILAISQKYGAIPRDLIDYKINVKSSSVDGYKVVEVGDFIISLRSFEGGIEYSNYLGICSPAYIILRPKIEVNRDFFRFYLKTYKYIQELKKKLEGIRDGKMISYKYFSEIKLPLPPLEEQTKIANFLSSIDKKIEQVNRQIEESKGFKKGLLQQMFV